MWFFWGILPKGEGGQTETNYQFGSLPLGVIKERVDSNLDMGQILVTILVSISGRNNILNYGKERR